MRRKPPVVSLKLAALALTCFLPSLGACGLLDAFEDDGSLVNIFVSHHATPENGEFPNRGVVEAPRIFDNDMGWRITLTEAYVTVTGVQVVACSGKATGVDLYWGPCAEDFIDTEDTTVIGIGGVKVGSGNYCAANVAYGPFDFLSATESDHLPENEFVDGKTVYLQGKAEKDGHDPVQFEWSTAKQIVVTLDTSTIEGGGPVKVEHDEAFPKDLTIGKPYDQFFTGIDFADYGDADLEAAVLSSLEQDTRVHFGAGVEVQYAAQ